jgi:hypothetical protein
MRSTIFRFLLSLLLVAVLPMQGYAATRMIACDMLATGLSAVANKETQVLQPSPVSDRSVAPLHSHHHDDVSGQQAPVGDMAVPADDAGHSGHAHAMPAGDMSHHASAHAKCNGCAPCCMGAVLTTAPLVLQAVPVDSDAFFAPASAHASAYVGLPDRPPQSFLV